MPTGTQLPFTITEPYPERFRWTKRRIDFYKLIIFGHEFFNNTNIRSYYIATFLYVSHINSNCANDWTPRRTCKGNVFECFLACRSGQRVSFINQPITNEYSILQR